MLIVQPKDGHSLCAFLASWICAAVASAQVQPFVYRPENGHWYRAVLFPSGITWVGAQAQAVAQNGYLATIADNDENEFVYGLVNSPEYWFEAPNPTRVFGPWIGGIQPPGSPEPAGGWRWIDNSPFVYSRWETNEPNNVGLAEDALHFFALGTARDRTWNDFGRNRTVLGYVVEVDCLWVASQPQSVSACVGSQVQFVVHAGSLEPFSCTWRKNNIVVSGPNVVCDPTQNTTRLSISNVQPADAGSYRFELSNLCSSFVSAPVTLNVLPLNSPLCRTCDSLDFNNDGISQDPTDLEAFFSVYSGGPCLPAAATCNDIDFNNDGLEQDPTDLEAFFSVYSGGPCL